MEKTPQELAEMAEREYLIGGEKTLELLKEGFIKGYQAAQEDKSLLNSILRHCDKYTNDADLGREVRKWMSKNL